MQVWKHICPRAVPQLYSLWVILKDVKQRRQAVHRFRRVFKACGKLKQQASKLLRLGQWRDARLEILDFQGSPFGFAVSELLPHLHRELEVVRRAFCPAFGCLRSAGTIERGIDLDGIEVTRVELQLVGFLEGIKNARP